MKNRGGHGVICQQTTDKTGLLASVAAVAEGEDVMIMTDEGTVIRTRAADIRLCSRSAKGVIIMRLAEGNAVRAFMCVEPEDEEDEAEIESAAESAVAADEGQEMSTPSSLQAPVEENAGAEETAE